MNLLDRYIGKTIVGSTVMVLLLFFGVQSFIQFLMELQDIGKGNYGVLQALVYVPLQSVNTMCQLFPVVGLIGCLLGLGRLATHRELIVMWSAGFSKLRINISIVKTTILMLVVVIFVGEVIGPQINLFATNYKSLAINNTAIGKVRSGWLRDGNDFLYINNVVSERKISDITRYQFANNKLRLVSYAKEGDLKKGQWMFNNVKQSEITPNGTKTKHFDQQNWHVSFNPKLLGVAYLATNYESLLSLHHILSMMAKNDLQSNRIAFAYYQRLFQPFSALVMIFLAIPFIFGPLRSSSMGFRMLVGVMVGFLFYTLNQFFGSFSMIYQVPPIWAASLPIMLFAVIDGALLWRAR